MSRKNISLTDPIEQRAQEIIKKRGFAGLSDLIAVLIREEYERREEGPAKPIEPPLFPPRPGEHLKLNEGKEKKPDKKPRDKSNSARVRSAEKKIVKIARRFASESANPPKS